MAITVILGRAFLGYGVLYFLVWFVLHVWFVARYIAQRGQVCTGRWSYVAIKIAEAMKKKFLWSSALAVLLVGLLMLLISWQG